MVESGSHLDPPVRRRLLMGVLQASSRGRVILLLRAPGTPSLRLGMDLEVSLETLRVEQIQALPPGGSRADLLWRHRPTDFLISDSGELREAGMAAGVRVLDTQAGLAYLEGSRRLPCPGRESAGSRYAGWR